MEIDVPTPVQRLAPGLWVKRDDLTSSMYGGNKVRKLTRLLADARTRCCDALITVGAWGSHHVLATSVFGSQQGFEVHGVVVPQPWTQHVEENMRADLAVGANLHPARNYGHAAATMARLSLSLRSQGRRPYVIGHGGSSPIGTAAYVHAAWELTDQMRRGELPEVDSIYVALGSGATAVGLALGLAATTLKTRVIAVRTISPWVSSRAWLGILAHRTARLIRCEEPSFRARATDAMRRLVIDGTQYGSGYGSETIDAIEATEHAARFGLTLDPTYTAKTFAACTRDAQADREILYWHTLSSADLTSILATAPAPPTWASDPLPAPGDSRPR